MNNVWVLGARPIYLLRMAAEKPVRILTCCSKKGGPHYRQAFRRFYDVFRLREASVC